VLFGVSRSGPGVSDLVWALPDIENHQYIAYYNKALTSYLRGNDKEAVKYVESAKGLQIDDNVKPELKKQIERVFDLLREVQEAFGPKIGEFREKFF
jgi:hypothetical protein